MKKIWLSRNHLKAVEAFGNLMNIINITENYIRISIKTRVFVAARFQFIDLSIQLWPCIIDDYA